MKSIAKTLKKLIKTNGCLRVCTKIPCKTQRFGMILVSKTSPESSPEPLQNLSKLETLQT